MEVTLPYLHKMREALSLNLLITKEIARIKKVVSLHLSKLRLWPVILVLALLVPQKQEKEIIIPLCKTIIQASKVISTLPRSMPKEETLSKNKLNKHSKQITTTIIIHQI